VIAGYNKKVEKDKKKKIVKTPKPTKAIKPKPVKKRDTMKDVKKRKP
jgi:hypothetical protein